MQFNKSLALLISTIGFSNLSYAEPITLYGKANLSAQLSDDGDGSFSELKSNASRVGVKGNVELEHGLELVYNLEWGVDISDESGADNISSRNQYVGLKGSFGSVLVGRKDSALKGLSKPVDVMNDYEADLKGLWKGENRYSNSVSYLSPSVNGFSVEVNYVFKDSVGGEDSVATAVYYGDTGLKDSKWFAGLALESDVKGYDVQRAILQGKLGAWVFGAVAHNQESTTTGESKSGLALSSQYKINSFNFKLQYQTLEDDNSYSLGADYKLSKSTKAYVWYTDRSLDESSDQSWLALGLEHKF